MPPLVRSSLLFALSYLILAAYFNLPMLLLSMNEVVHVMHFLFFFVLAYAVAKILQGMGLELYGIRFLDGWKRNLFLGFGFGFLAWVLLFGLYFVSGRYTLTGVNSLVSSLLAIVAVVIGYGFGSFINDMIVRGLVFHYFWRRLPGTVVILIAILFYALDDIWYAGLSLQNTIFSAALGLSLTWIFYYTRSIWASAGIHIGLNIVYGLFFGVSGNSADGIFILQINEQAWTIAPWLSTLVSLGLFTAVYQWRYQFSRAEVSPSGCSNNKKIFQEGSDFPGRSNNESTR
jgi:membrane protease YdiL (CAAX protease family)